MGIEISADYYLSCHYTLELIQYEYHLIMKACISYTFTTTTDEYIPI